MIITDPYFLLLISLSKLHLCIYREHDYWDHKEFYWCGRSECLMECMGTLCFFAIFCTGYDLRPAIWSEPVFNTCEEVNDDDKVHGCFITIYNLHCGYWIWLQGGFKLDSYIKMYEIGHDGIQCKFLPPFDLKVSLDNSLTEIKFTMDTFSILFLLDKLRNLGMDGLQVTQSCLEHTTWCMKSTKYLMYKTLDGFGALLGWGCGCGIWSLCWCEAWRWGGRRWLGGGRNGWWQLTTAIMDLSEWRSVRYGDDVDDVCSLCPGYCYTDEPPLYPAPIYTILQRSVYLFLTSIHHHTTLPAN